MTDFIHTIGNSVIHHGYHSNRAYLMSLDSSDAKSMPDRLFSLANEKGYTKIIAKIARSHLELFEEKGYRVEAHIPGYFNGKTDGFFVSLYLDEKRKRDASREMCAEILNIAKNKRTDNKPAELMAGCVFQKMAPSDTPEMADLYSKVFKSYPFPIFDESYLRKTMEENIIYFGIKKDGKIIGLSSIERDIKNFAAEMTDFAVVMHRRGGGMARYLLLKMEHAAAHLGIKTMFTIARARSTGMNVAFSKSGYCYGGTLVNNTNIAGHIESMNVWYKHVSPH